MKEKNTLNILQNWLNLIGAQKSPRSYTRLVSYKSVKSNTKKNTIKINYVKQIFKCDTTQQK